MATSRIRRPAVLVEERIKETFIRRDVLGGLINWYEKSRTDALGVDLVISTGGELDRIFIDGKQITLP